MDRRCAISYEGYEQYLCANGHEWSHDCYEYVNPNESICPRCGEPAAWFNAVNNTNGSHETITPERAEEYLDRLGLWDAEEIALFEKIIKSGEPYEDRIDGYVELEVDHPTVKETCDKCGVTRIVSPATYKIPGDKGHMIKEE